MNYLVDTSVLVRAVHTADPASILARHALGELALRQDGLVVLPQIVAEFWVVATRPTDQNGLGYAPTVAGRLLGRFRTGFQMRFETPAVYQQWRKLILDLSVRGKPAHDARLAAAVHAHELDAILTFNVRHFQRYSELNVVHPADI